MTLSGSCRQVQILFLCINHKCYMFYLRDTQHRIPERARNHREPMKRKTDNPAVAHKMISKYHEVRVVEVFWREIMSAHLNGVKASREDIHTVKHNLPSPVLVISSTISKLLKTHRRTKVVRKFRYESSRLICPFSLGATQGSSARFTVTSN